MPDIPTGAQIFDLVFHPNNSTVYTGLLTGEIKAFGYDEQGGHTDKFSLKPSKRSCRGLDISEDGSQLWAVGKGKGVYTIDTATGTVTETRAGAHDSPINRVKRLMPHMLCTGDDDGVIKLWDPRKPDALRSYTHHYDFISDFLWLEDKKQLVTTSGDGTLSVIDVRSKKTEPFAQSEDQEDELLSIVSIKGDSKIVVGTQIGMLSIFHPGRSGWADLVDRVPGHPHSIDALCALPSSYPSSSSTILTGSSDGLLRAVQLFPTKLLGVVADHGEFPVERIAVDRGGEGRWVGSAGHEEVLRLTDLKDVFEDEDDEVEEEDGVNSKLDQEASAEDDTHVEDQEDNGNTVKRTADESRPLPQPESEVDEDEDDSDADVPKAKKRKRQKDSADASALGRAKKGKNQVDADPSFFAEL
ncbi:hypothetical protein PLICRDRAFT_105979 [Plicaturopsis crispa FD-325 SS-3]|nr:hypothetical protein PLICRDRAFT_105979 [Plicaturopsis crispa FD-325 SS-3]